MGRMIKSVSLPPHLHAKAEAIGNFSAFVQEALENEGDTVNLNACRPLDILGVCNGLRKPTCGHCYPRGPPTIDEWKAFRASTLKMIDQGYQAGVGYELKVSEEERIMHFEQMLSAIAERKDGVLDLKEKEEARHAKKKRKGFFKRLKNAVYAFKE